MIKIHSDFNIGKGMKLHRTMRKKFFSYYVILVVSAMAVTGFFVTRLAQSLYKRNVEEKLASVAKVIQNEISEDIKEGVEIDYNAIAAKYSEILEGSPQDNATPNMSDLRVTIIDLNGKVLGESETDFRSMENHLSRSEVQQALKGSIGKDIRHSRTLDTDFTYVAVKASEVIIRLSLPLTELRDIRWIILRHITLGILVSLLFTVFLALKFSASVTRPVNELINASREIASGNYSKRVKSSADYEFSQLADTFNEMAYQLERTVADLTDKNIKVETIINSMMDGIIAVDDNYNIVLINDMAKEMFGMDRKDDVIGINIIEAVRNNQLNSFISKSVEDGTSSIKEILIAGAGKDGKTYRIHTNPVKPVDNAKKKSGAIVLIQDITNIKKLEQIRTDFVSNVTHELKTPLTSIRGFIETLRSGAMNDPEVAESFLEIIDIESERLYNLINDILQLSEIETRQKDSNILPHSLNSSITEVISILQGPAEKKNVRLIDETSEELTISANKDRIKQMLINLIDNGIKYNVEGGSVFVKAYRHGGNIVISVKDTGIGIAQEHLPRIFERFYRVDKGRSREAGGTGLGLSIVKHIASLYNGDVRVSSQPGIGTEFTVRLPL